MPCFAGAKVGWVGADGGVHATTFLIRYQPHHSPVEQRVPTGPKAPAAAKGCLDHRVRLQIESRKRDLAMFNLAIDSKLRGCDLVRLQVNDVCVGGRVRDRAVVIQKKTGRSVQFELTEQTRLSVQEWLDRRGVTNSGSMFSPADLRNILILVSAVCSHCEEVGGERRAR